MPKCGTNRREGKALREASKEGELNASARANEERVELAGSIANRNDVHAEASSSSGYNVLRIMLLPNTSYTELMASSGGTWTVLVYSIFCSTIMTAP